MHRHSHTCVCRYVNVFIAGSYTYTYIFPSDGVLEFLYENGRQHGRRGPV